MTVAEIKLQLEKQKEQRIEFANADSVYNKLFQANKIAINSGANSVVSVIGKADTAYQEAKKEAQLALSELQKLDPSLGDTKYGLFLKQSIQIADDNVQKLRQAQGSVNNALKLINSLQNKSKL